MECGKTKNALYLGEGIPWQLSPWKLGNYLIILRGTQIGNRFQWQRVLRRRCGTALMLGLWVQSQPMAWMSVSRDCCVLSGGALRVGLITCPEESYRVCCVWVSIMRGPWPTRGCCAIENNWKYFLGPQVGTGWGNWSVAGFGVSGFRPLVCAKWDFL